jgi:hypothetical protein
VYDLIGLPTGNLTVTDAQAAHWGSQLTIDCLYSYPPEEKTFRLIFKNCSSVQWFVARSDGETAQLLTHDLGEGNHQHTARIATVLFEVIIAYGELVIEKGW